MNEAAYLERLRALWSAHWPAGVAREPDYPFGQVPLTDYLRAWAAKQPDKPAVIFYGTELSYAELDRLSDAFASLLAAHGVGQGDRVAVFLPNCPQFLIAFYGLLKLGCVHVPINPMFREHELLYKLEDTGAVAILAQDQLMPLLRTVQARTPLRTVFVTSLAEMIPSEPTLPLLDLLRAPRISCPDAIDLLPALAAVTQPPPQVTVGLDDVAALNYTGGTTGMPKGCVHTQRDMIYTAATTGTCANGTDASDQGDQHGLGARNRRRDRPGRHPPLDHARPAHGTAARATAWQEARLRRYLVARATRCLTRRRQPSWISEIAQIDSAPRPTLGLEVCGLLCLDCAAGH